MDRKSERSAGRSREEEASTHDLGMESESSALRFREEASESSSENDSITEDIGESNTITNIEDTSESKTKNNSEDNSDSLNENIGDDINDLIAALRRD